jgi:DNA-binding NarL/FixJ family response regulator
MKPADLIRILDQLEQLGPQRRLSSKRSQLTDVRERLLSLHARGHSWRAIARELSASGETVTADLLRSVCKAKAKQRKRSTTRRDPEAPAAARLRPRPAADKRSPATVPPPKPVAAFGAKGLQL